MGKELFQKENKKFKLGILEAQSGIEPSIRWCKDVVTSRIKRKAGSNVELEKETIQARVDALRRERIKGKLHVMEKHINKALKKTKTFEVQKCVRRLRQLREDQASTASDKVAREEERLRLIKGANVSKHASWILWEQIIEKTEYVQDRLKQLHVCAAGATKDGDSPDDNNDGGGGSGDGNDDNNCGIKLLIACNSFRKFVQDGRNEVESFIKELFRETCVKEDKNDEQDGAKVNCESDEAKVDCESDGAKGNDAKDKVKKNCENAKGRTKDGSSNDAASQLTSEPMASAEAASSCFVMLNKKAARPAKKANASRENDSTNKKKNRPGQQARRLLWEQKYGQEAKHLQAVDSKGSINRLRERTPQFQSKRTNDEKSRFEPRSSSFGAGSRKFEPRTGRFETGSNRIRSSAPTTKFESKLDKFDEPSHPSWQAKRALKEQMSKATFQGTKIVFEE